MTTLAAMNELVVDNFAGGGGASHGIELGLGRPVDIAINHDPEAVAMHRVNHPHARHYAESVWDIDPRAVTRGLPVGLGWFSPDCTFHSKARGGKPFRDLAWIVVRWIKAVRPRVIMLENVEEFADWGPLLPDGKPCPQRRGLTFRNWHRQIENLGYQVDMRELKAHEYGTPTSRKRLFIIARCDGSEIVFPEAMHGPGLQPYRTAADCIDWSIPCPSIFERDRPLAEATLRRIARGIMRYVVNNPRPFIVGVGGRMGQSPERSVDRPYQTITAKADAALVVPTLIQAGYGERQGQAPRILDLHKPLGTVVAGGNKHALVMAFLARHYGGHENDGAQMGLPMHTVTAKDHHALVTSHIVKLKGTCRDGQPVTEPLHTIQAGGTHFGEVRAFLLKYYGTDQDPRLENPLGTVTTKDRFGLVMVHGEPYAIADIGMRMLTPRELFNAQGFAREYVIDHGLDEGGARIDLTKTAQVRMAGNSVCPPVAKALVEANVTRQHEQAAA